MAVKVNSLSSGSLKGIGNNDAIDRTDKSSNAYSADAASTSHDDTVSLTGTAAQLQQIQSQIAKMSVVDAQLVQEVQHKLATGSFRTNADSAASKLLTMETSLP
jgi:flagellar biosynthesis anti-sigma factor FlgM